ncbi:2-C-methyl-D-erythritol 4-phosphate cytidylyltransferase [Mycoplasmoides pneumoniae]|uniref:Uncharacterized protein MG116 homolog n=4 Tax=Mycoplasmoides pneumoniae TaxID=2104 RepID=Y255_MYCPN|nr:2-C-methyl-D-erythritol 4-phosphate cytidylyltransferase [Mycoplasmoides pneumoniae]P75519.1 RecName: Full=Uncharacterized protein MG116 homolog [Mycoplasmoides pneumoniae M129]AAB96226.1 conserved hypothetical protein [Mycoplasmoides pneumoniae M129]ADK86881.1 conserved hypothetical protein [Mycoplasmoides pneumoniae FH]AGC04180.1 hypothetical protein C985_0253 [Mycoplasmoides pneumoniae M129-B7]ALA30137.1 hypothetical protein C897_01430 [Mycoplasmoides pneumoniae PI 1428]ALA31090.1 hypot
MQRTLNVGVILCESFISNAQNPVNSYIKIYENVRMFEFAIKLLQESRINFQKILLYVLEEQIPLVEKVVAKYENCWVFRSKHNEVEDIYEAKGFIEDKYKIGLKSSKNQASSYYDNCCFVVLEACRPLTSKKVVKNVYEKAMIDGAAVAVLPFERQLVCGDNTKAVRQLKDKGNMNYWRQSSTWELQFPQAYTLNKLNQYHKNLFMKARNMLDLMNISAKNPLSIVDGSAYSFRVVTSLDFEILLGILRNG